MNKIENNIKQIAETASNIFDVCLRARLKILENDYDRSESPLFLWKIMELCLKYNMPITGKVKEYFINSIEKITSTEFANDNSRYEDICKHLLLKGDQPFNKYSKIIQKRLFVVAYYCLLLDHLLQNPIPESQYHRNILKKVARNAAQKGMQLHVTDDRTLRNWINDFKMQPEDLMSFFSENFEILNDKFPDIPWGLPVAAMDNFDQLEMILANF